jgi:hypothetical protein
MANHVAIIGTGMGHDGDAGGNHAKGQSQFLASLAWWLNDCYAN